MDEVAFSQASEWYRQRGKGFSYSAKLKLYGLFKQVNPQNRLNIRSLNRYLRLVRIKGLKDGLERKHARNKES